MNTIESYETQHLTLFCGNSETWIRKNDRLKWELTRTGVEGINKSVIINTSRSYEERLDFKTLRLEHGGVYHCGDRTIDLKVRGKV